MALFAVLACGGGDDSAVPDAQAHTLTTPGDSAARAAEQAPATPASGRPSPTVTLAAGDIGEARHARVEEGIAITGDLRPIENVEVRARLEGDLVGVYVREGERVSAGQVIARFEASEQESALASAEADRVAAESELSTAQWNSEQSAELFKAGAISELDYKTAQQSVVAARARLAAAQSRVRATTSTVRDTRVVAPTSGVIERRIVENGMHVARGAPLFTLVRSNVLELAASVPARQANAVRVGQTVHFNADGRAFDGKVARVSPTIDPASRSITVYTQIANGNGALKGGTFASGRVVSRTVASTLVVPSAAVRQSSGRAGLYVYRIAGKTLEVAPVQVGIVDDRAGITEILSGLASGDRVIVGNVGTLGRGMQVIIVGDEGAGRPQAKSQ